MTAARIERCPWHGISDPLYARYHDEEWGVPHADSQRMFEKLVLESFQSGLSWLTILKKRENFRRAFHSFDAARMARYTDKDRIRLLADAGIVRHRLKIEAAIANARACMRLSDRTTLAAFLWGFLDGKPIVNSYRSFAEIPGHSEHSNRIAKALKAEGFCFLGPTTVYAFMQSTGMVNDHLVDCPRYNTCKTLQKKFRAH